MPKVSKIKSRRPQGDILMVDASELPMADALDLAASDQFKDTDDNVDIAMPALPPILKAASEEARAGLGGEGGGGVGPGLDAGLESHSKSVSISLPGGSGGIITSKDPADDGGAAAAENGASLPTTSTSGLLGSIAPPTSLASDFRGGQESWNAMLYQLLLYKAQRGDLNIPHNDTSYRLLYNWVQTQRRHYKLYQENKTSSTFLNADRIAVLDAIDFQWNVRGDNFWQKNYDALVEYKNEHGDVRVPRLYTKNPKLGEWVTDQRRQWKSKMEGKPNMMTDERKAKLDDLGFVWRVRDRADWNDRYEQLLEFKKENGHCIVPQHYTRNRALGKWVAKQREQYRFYREGKHSFLTEERIDLLKSVGFVWQIKGRGAKKNILAGAKSTAVASAASRERAEDALEKSLAKQEAEEEKALERAMKVEGPTKLHSGSLASRAAEESFLKDPPALDRVEEPQKQQALNLLQQQAATMATAASINGAGGNTPSLLSGRDSLSLNGKDGLSLPALGKDGGLSLPALGKDGSLSLSSIGKNTGLSLPSMGQDGGLSLPALGKDGGLSLPPMGKEGGLSLLSLGKEGGLSLPSLGKEGGLSLPSMGKDGGLSLPSGRDGGASLPSISQHQLLQANMAAIAAHASSNQNMVADLAAVLRLNDHPTGGRASGLGDPRAVAAIRAAQLSDPKGSTFSGMI